MALLPFGSPPAPKYDKGGQVYNVKAYGAKGDGTTDDTAAIQSALTAATYGSTVFMPAGTYRTSAPLLLPPYVTMRGTRGNVYLTTDYGTVIKPLSTFSIGTAASAAVILICDQTSGGWAVQSNEQVVSDLYIDQSAMVKGTNWADGIEILGAVSGYQIHDVQINQCTSTAIHAQTNGSGQPGTGRLTHILTQGSYYSGFGVISNDTTYIDCVSLGDGTNGFAGWTISGAGNCKWIGCRSEWATGDGFNITNSTTFNLAQTMNFVGCSTDRNSKNGVYITGTAQTAINFSGCYIHRDGRNGGSGGGGYAHFNIAGYAGMVNISGCSTAPGVDDNGSGPDTPQYAVATSGTNGQIMVDGTILHAYTAILNNAGTNNFFLISPTCLQATGADSSPTFGTPTPLPSSLGGVPTTTKGDLAGFNTASARVSVGSDGQVLQADSTNALGVSYKFLGTSSYFNYVANPSFETAYTAWSNYGVYGTIARDNTTSESGTYSSKQDNATTANDGGIMSSSNFTLQPGQYTFSVWAKIQSTVTNACMVVRGNGGVYVQLNQAYPGNANWNRYTGTFTLASADTGMNILLGLGSYGTTSPGVVNYDAVQLELNSSATTYFDGDTASSGNNTYAWTGTAEVSTSVKKTATALTTTDYLPEGTNNLYFTNPRAVSAMNNATITPSQVNAGGIFAYKYQGNVRTLTAATTLGYDPYIRCDATAAAFTVTLPDAGTAGCIITLKKIDSSVNVVTIACNGAQKIEGAATKTLSAQYKSYALYSNGSNWEILSAT